MMYRIMYRIVALVPRYVSVSKNMYRCSPSHKVSRIPCQTNLRITNHRGHKFPPSENLLSFKIRINWRLVLTAMACFPSVLFKLQQCSRKHSSFLPHKAALMTKTELSSEFNSAFAVSFHSIRSQLSQV